MAPMDHWEDSDNPALRAAATAAPVVLLVAAVGLVFWMRGCSSGGSDAPPPRAVPAANLSLDPPGPREFVLDRAGLLDEAAEERLRTACDALLTETATPIVVVTIQSRATYGGAGMSIESFARDLFDRWGVGVATVNGRDWNTGVLLLVASADREARIELGAGWGHEKDAAARRIIDELIVPRFKRERYGEGIEAGVEALGAMVRGRPLPDPPTPWWAWPAVLGGLGLAVFTGVSLARHGSGGWAWLFWTFLFALLAATLYHAATRRSRGGGGYGGGSFGGGSSGGGGASGSW